MENSKLEELIKQDSKGIGYVNFASMPGKIELEKEGYHFVDEKDYIMKVESYISVFHPNNPDLAHCMVLKRNFENEFEKLGEINKIIPENSVKPIALVYDNSISNNYIRGYLTKTDGELYKLKSYLKLEKEKVKDIGSDNITKTVTDIENQLSESVNKLKVSKMYNKLPRGALSLDNIYVTEKNKVILLNTNYFMGFSDKDPRYLDKELQKTIKYLEKKKF
ncbi:MAG: hypothetical protein QXD02_04425 [Candidatus Parvarchaeum sp.]|nr:hypothetical protein [Candidatus Parvarchaeum tengchongense]MCW1299537.1 hypothetical protein [Candidatus Parvarchaeum tengchongense]